MPRGYPIARIKWHRLVLDEAHTAKSPKAGFTKVCAELASDNRWCATGTPAGGDITDLFGQFCVLNLQPFTDRTFFSVFVRSAYSGSMHTRAVAHLLLYILGRCMIRHTKLQVLGGEEVLKLPPKTEELLPLNLTSAEQQLYMHVYDKAKEVYLSLRAQGPKAVSQNLLKIMSTLLPLRRICSGGSLSYADLRVDCQRCSGRDAEAEGAERPVPICTEDSCCICMESPILQPATTKCNHWFCRDCILGYIGNCQANLLQASCPLCRASIQSTELVCGVNAAVHTYQHDPQVAGLQEQASVSDSKLQALLHQLHLMRQTDPTAKALVFSQFVGTIEWLKVKLEEQGFGYRTISGSMSLQQRSKAKEAFQKDPPTTVFLLSMRSGAVGINLTSANYVFVLEPALNPGLEEQAVGRAWRMGQQRPVTVKKLYVKGSVEERIMDMVQHRQTGSNSQSGASAAGSSAIATAGHTQVKAQDIAGSMKADKQNLRMEELDLLFQTPAFV
ncbi:TPA: hypothetical protein ACH3X2_010298 [Trebouxia sp. C0005]